VHQIYVGTDHEKQPFFLSVVLTDTNNQGAPQYKAILWKKTVIYLALLFSFFYIIKKIIINPCLCFVSFFSTTFTNFPFVRDDTRYSCILRTWFLLLWARRYRELKRSTYLTHPVDPWLSNRFLGEFFIFPRYYFKCDVSILFILQQFSKYGSTWKES